MFDPRGPTFFELAVQALSSTRRGYDLLAPKFDHTPFRTPDPFFQRFLEVWQEFEQPTEVDVALDICCGTGAAIEHLHPICRHDFLGVDFSTGMLRQARRNLEGFAGRPRLSLVQADFRSLPFRENIDLAVCFGALGHVLRREEASFIAQVFRVLKPGGRFAFVTHRMPSLISPIRWAAHGFNTAMKIRNLLIQPPFIMYYLTFLWPDIGPKLRDAGFVVRHHPLLAETETPFYYLVVAEKPADAWGHARARLTH